MKPTAIVYSSNTGKTERYAHILSDELSIPAYSLSQAKEHLEKGANIIYMGWLMAATVKDLPKANKRYNVCVVCGVGLCPTGEMLNEVRSAARIPNNVPLFTVQGGMDKEKLKGVYAFMIKMLIKMMTSKKNKTEADLAMLDLLLKGGDYVCKENLLSVIEWYNKE